MAKGRKAVPTAIKKLRGNPGKRKLPTDEPTLPASEPPENIPACPVVMDEVAKARWGYDALQLTRMKVLTDADQGILEMRSLAYSEIWKINKILETENLVIDTFTVDKEGNAFLSGRKAHPLVAHRTNLMRVFNSCGSLLGLDPASRVKLKTEKAPEEDDIMKLLKAKRAE